MSCSTSSAEDTKVLPDSGETTIFNVEPEMVVTVNDIRTELGTTSGTELTISRRLKRVGPVHPFCNNCMHPKDLKNIVL